MSVPRMALVIALTFPLLVAPVPLPTSSAAARSAKHPKSVAARVAHVRRVTGDLAHRQTRAADDVGVEPRERDQHPADEAPSPSTAERRILADAPTPGLHVLDVNTHSGEVRLFGVVRLATAGRAPEASPPSEASP